LAGVFVLNGGERQTLPPPAEKAVFDGVRDPNKGVQTHE
jgi:hypothetical protein